MLHEPAIDQRVDRRAFIGEQGIDHLHRNPLPAYTRFDHQGRQLGRAIGVATQLGDAHRAAVVLGDDEAFPLKVGGIESGLPHHGANGPLILLAGTPDSDLHIAIIPRAAASPERLPR